MFTDSALQFVKARLGISTSIRDSYLMAIIEGVESELASVHGIDLDPANNAHLMFVVDYAEYRYSNRDAPNMPRHLQWRLHNLVIGGGKRVE